MLLQVRSSNFRDYVYPFLTEQFFKILLSVALELVHELAEYLHRLYPTIYSVTRHSAGKSTYGWYGENDIKTVTVVPLNKTFNLDEEDPLRVATMLYVISSY